MFSVKLDRDEKPAASFSPFTLASMTASQLIQNRIEENKLDQKDQESYVRLISRRQMQFGVAAVTSMFLSDFINKRVQSRAVKLLVVIVSSLLPATTYLLNDPKEFFVKTPNSALGRDSRAAIRVLMAANSSGMTVAKHPVVTAFARFYPEAAREEADSDVSPALLAEIDKIVADIMLKKPSPARVPDAASDEAPRVAAPTAAPAAAPAPVALRSTVSTSSLPVSPSAASKAATSAPAPAPPTQHYDDDDDFYESSPPASAGAGDRRLKSGGKPDRLRALEEKFHGRQTTSTSASAGSAAPAAGRASATRTAGSGAGKPRAPFPPVDDADEYVDPWAEPPPRAVRPAAGAGANGGASGRKPIGRHARDSNGGGEGDW